MSTQTKKPNCRELSPEDMSMHDIVALFILTGLLAKGQHKPEQLIEQSMVFADLFMKVREKENDNEKES
jgi:hypothetical protein